MNRERRREIARAQKLIADARDILDEVRTGEEDAIDGTSSAAKQHAMEAHVDVLDGWIDDLDDMLGVEFE